MLLPDSRERAASGYVATHDRRHPFALLWPLVAFAALCGLSLVVGCRSESTRSPATRFEPFAAPADDRTDRHDVDGWRPREDELPIPLPRVRITLPRTDQPTAPDVNVEPADPPPNPWPLHGGPRPPGW